MNTLRFAALACALTLSGCGTLPSLSPKPEAAAPETEVAAAETTAETTGPVSKMPWPNACSVYDAEKELPDYQFKQDTGDDLACKWKQDDTTVLDVAMYRDMAIDAVPEDSRSKVTVTMVGKRSAVVVEKHFGRETRCKVAVAADGGTMYVSVLTGDLQESCDVAKKAAEAIEPKLPGY
ncbi:hypothetical protein BBK82_11565 [Lentzea guizhouensis]|uniref:DUF3558 domain-containing protein n=1 Tax=Lentzea guizhouensis TaxID=1586287 RepID=A0A1B2HFU4_9PSEU|nr:hypothetical protein [Lentzea guizhouensis]ANZ36608.1 hypothetical protein BBK82_11565 [Lentzea guizhouensis]